MHTEKSKHALDHEELMALAAPYRTQRAATFDSAEGWQCGRGHAGDNTLSAAQNVRCMNCASQTTREAYRAADSAGGGARGQLVSASYVDASTALEWECAFGHSWQALPDHVARRWCEECASKRVYDKAMIQRAV